MDNFQIIVRHLTATLSDNREIMHLDVPLLRAQAQDLTLSL